MKPKKNFLLPMQNILNIAPLFPINAISSSAKKQSLNIKEPHWDGLKQSESPLRLYLPA